MNSIVTEGYLKKKSRYLGSSRKRWCVLRGKWLLTYKQKQIYKDPTEQFDLTIYDQIQYPDQFMIKYKFILVSTVKNMKRREFIAQSYHEMIHWVDNIISVYRNLKQIKKYPHILHHDQPTPSVSSKQCESEKSISSTTHKDKEMIEDNHFITVNSDDMEKEKTAIYHSYYFENPLNHKLTEPQVGLVCTGMIHSIADVAIELEYLAKEVINTVNIYFDERKRHNITESDIKSLCNGFIRSITDLSFEYIPTSVINSVIVYFDINDAHDFKNSIFTLHSLKWIQGVATWEQQQIEYEKTINHLKKEIEDLTNENDEMRDLYIENQQYISLLQSQIQTEKDINSTHKELLENLFAQNKKLQQKNENYKSTQTPHKFIDNETYINETLHLENAIAQLNDLRQDLSKQKPYEFAFPAELSPVACKKPLQSYNIHDEIINQLIQFGYTKNEIITAINMTSDTMDMESKINDIIDALQLNKLNKRIELLQKQHNELMFRINKINCN